jgi:hypothetical protein
MYVWKFYLFFPRSIIEFENKIGFENYPKIASFFLSNINHIFVCNLLHETCNLFDKKKC